MAYNTKAIEVDVNQKPIPQIYNPVTDEYEVLQGANGAARHIIYGADGQPISTTGNKLAVRASEIETLLESLDGKDFATQTTLAAILAKIIAAPATEAKQDTLIGHVDGVESALASILAKLIAAPATEAKQDALNVLIGEVQANPTANTLLARIKALEDKLTSGISLSGSNVPDAQAIPMTQAQKDVRAKSIDNILDIIGYENIKMFLPLSESVGSTLAYDLLRKDLTFDVSGLVTFGTTGLFGDCATFAGGYLVFIVPIRN